MQFILRVVRILVSTNLRFKDYRTSWWPPSLATVSLLLLCPWQDPLATWPWLPATQPPMRWRTPKNLKGLAWWFSKLSSLRQSHLGRGRGVWSTACWARPSASDSDLVWSSGIGFPNQFAGAATTPAPHFVLTPALIPNSQLFRIHLPLRRYLWFLYSIKLYLFFLHFIHENWSDLRWAMPAWYQYFSLHSFLLFQKHFLLWGKIILITIL